MEVRKTDDNVDYVLWAYRSQPHSITKFSPYYLMYGREMTGPLDNELKAYVRSQEGPEDVMEQVNKLARKMKAAREIAMKNSRQGKETQREYHDRKATKIEYFPGQLVYKRQMVRGRKLENQWTGPYKIIKKISDFAYHVLGHQGRPWTVNVEQLKLCRATREQLLQQRRNKRKERMERADASEYPSESESELGGNEEYDRESWATGAKVTEAPDEVKGPQLQEMAGDDSRVANAEPLEARGERRYDFRPRRMINYKD
jgi:hypothetical protein